MGVSTHFVRSAKSVSLATTSYTHTCGKDTRSALCVNETRLGISSKSLVSIFVHSNIEQRSSVSRITKAWNSTSTMLISHVPNRNAKRGNSSFLILHLI
jgi:hypothetical protein